MSAEEYHYEDDWYYGYVETSVDPGPWLIIGTLAFCILSIALMPCVVSLGRRYEKRRLNATTREEVTDHVGETIEANGGEMEVRQAPSLVSQAPTSYVHGKEQRSEVSSGRAMSDITGRRLKNLIDKVVMPPYPDDVDGSNFGRPHSTVGGGRAQSEAGGRAQSDSGGRAQSEAASSFHTAVSYRSSRIFGGSTTVLDTGAYRNRNAARRRFRRQIQDDLFKNEQKKERKAELELGAALYNPLGNRENEASSRSILKYGEDESVASKSIMSRLEDNALSPNDAVDAHDQRVMLNERVGMEGEDIDLCCGDHAWWRPSMIANAFNRILEIAEWDRETKRITAIAVPFSLAALAEGINDTIRVALIAHFLGTEAVSAYTIVDILLGLTEEFFGGFALTQTSLCSQAYGSKNYRLAGEYVQISSILYSLCMIPNILFWMFMTDDVVKLFGFNDNVAQMAQEYARLFLFAQWIEGFDEGWAALLEITGHERWSVFVGISSEVVATLVLVGFLLTQPDMTLTDVAIIELAVTVLFFGFNCVVTVWFGWMKRFTQGMFRTCAMRNKVAVCTVFRTAIPLAFGQLLQYGEWEILTIFVAHIGPAEVTAWGILGTLWDTLELLTEGFGDAGEIRVAFHLGSGNPARARLSSYKTILVSVIFATLFTSIVWILGIDLAIWLTPDPTLQYLIAELLPLVGIGNISLTAGSVSWALVGAQGRYRLATLVAFVTSWSVTMPLAAIFTYGLNLDMQGVTSSVVIGYTVTGSCLTYILIRSDWERLSRIIVELNAAEESSSDESSSDESDSDDESYCSAAEESMSEVYGQ